MGEAGAQVRHKRDACDSIVINRFLSLQMLLKKVEDAIVLIIPGVRAGEAVPFAWVDHHFEIGISALD